jgi:hypothetical protein
MNGESPKPNEEAFFNASMALLEHERVFFAMGVQ